MKKLLILGAGGHGKVVADAAEAMGCWEEIAFLDDEKYLEKTHFFKKSILGPIKSIQKYDTQQYQTVIAIGNNQSRHQLLNQLIDFGFSLPVITHPSARVSSSAYIDIGTVLFANAVVNPDARIGKAVIINSAAVVEHDCVVGDAAHISPNATLAGAVQVGHCAWVGMGTCILQNVAVGEHSIIGAGAVAIHDIPSHVVAIGVPAKVTHHLDTKATVQDTIDTSKEFYGE